MPVDLDRAIDYHLYLATQKYIALYIQRTESDDAAGTGKGTAAASDRTAPDIPAAARTERERGPSPGWPRNPQDASIGSGDGWEVPAVPTPSGPLSSRRSQPPDESGSFVPVSVGDLEEPVVSPGASGESEGREGTVSESGNGATAPVQDYTAPSTDEDSTADEFATAVGSLNLSDTASPGDASSPEPEPEGRPRQPPPPVATEEQIALPSLQSQNPNSPTPSTHHDPNPLARVTSITLLVEDLHTTTRFYRDVFSSPPVYEDESSAYFRFNDGALLVGLHTSSGARARKLLGDGVRVGRTRDVGRRVQLSVAVEDVDEEYARLRRLEEAWNEEAGRKAEGSGPGSGPGLGPGLGRPLVIEGLTWPRTRPWGARTVTFQDPSGHCWELAEEVWES